jgi:hypothetical protein
MRAQKLKKEQIQTYSEEEYNFFLRTIPRRTITYNAYTHRSRFERIEKKAIH